jgi:alkanesulfonate monooxygenase SsuD/methylene tetrahydromethanopterin reductase-like flavin-dependent oxidoreductase (luciferase family)
MKFGFIATTGSIDEVLEMATAVEDHGWDGFFYWDGIGPGNGEFWDEANANPSSMTVFDPWTVLAAAAVKTERITLGAMIFPLSRRRPWKVAREALTVDHLSRGRLVIPVGLGAIDEAGFARVHPEVTDRKQRAERLDETLDILQLAWTGKPFSYAGAHYQLDNVVFWPPAIQQPRIPLWAVGAWPRPKSMARTARLDGIVPSIADDPFRQLTPDEIRDIVDWERAHRDTDVPFDVVLEGVSPADDAEWVESTLRPLATAGATWWIESRWEAPNDPATLLERIRQGPPRL